MPQRRRSRRIRVSPADVKFTQDSIAMSFKDKDRPDVNSTCVKIAIEELAVSSIPAIRVVNIRGVYNRYENLFMLCLRFSKIG